MVSDGFRKLEESVVAVECLYDDLIDAIAHKLGKEKTVIDQAVLRACVTVGALPNQLAHDVNEFLLFLLEQKREISPKEEE